MDKTCLADSGFVIGDGLSFLSDASFARRSARKRAVLASAAQGTGTAWRFASDADCSGFEK